MYWTCYPLILMLRPSLCFFILVTPSYAFYADYGSMVDVSSRSNRWGTYPMDGWRRMTETSSSMAARSPYGVATDDMGTRVISTSSLYLCVWWSQVLESMSSFWNIDLLPPYEDMFKKLDIHSIYWTCYAFDTYATSIILFIHRVVLRGHFGLGSQTESHTMRH